jgi:hypothetical protein
MLDSTLLVNTISRILSNSVLIKELEIERRERDNPLIGICDFHDIFLVIFTILLTTMKYSLIGLVITYIIYEIICYFVNGSIFSNLTKLNEL